MSPGPGKSRGGARDRYGACGRRLSNWLRIGFLALLVNQLAQGPPVAAGKDKGDDIILAKGKIILRGGKGKGNIILDPGHSSDGHHEMPHIMPMMSHFNPYAFYPMHQHHQQHEHQHQPQVMIRPIYIEDHSAMHQVPMPELHHHEQHQPHQEHHQEHHQQHHEEEHHHEPQHHEPHHHHDYHHEEPQHHHYEPQHHEMEHQQHHEEEEHQHQHEQPHYESGEEHQHESYEGHHGHPALMSLMSMHGSGPQPIYQANQANQEQQLQQLQQMDQQQQMAAFQALQQPAMYAQLSPGAQQTMAYQQAQYLAAEKEAALRQQQLAHQAPQEVQQGQSSEVSSNSPSDASGAPSASSASSAPSKPVSKVTALLEKSANSPLIQKIKPLFKRNKDQKDSSQKKP